MRAGFSNSAAQEILLQEEQDYRFAGQLADKQLHDLAALQFRKYADTWPTSPRAPEALFSAAESYEAIKAYDRAADTYLRLILSYPQSAIADKALFNRGKLLAQLGDPLNAALTLERIRLFMPKSELIPLSLVSAAEQFRQAGEPKRAIDAAMTMIAQYPDSPLRVRARIILARLQRDARKPVLALQELDKIASDKTDPALGVQSALLRGQVLSDLGRYAKSDSVLETLIHSDMTSDSIGVAAWDLARSLHSRGLYQRAIQTTERALGRSVKDTEKARLRLIQGDSYTALGEPAKALRAFDGIALQTLPAWDQAKLAFRRGVLQQRLNEPALALPWFAGVLAQPDTLPGIITLHRQALARQTRLFLELGNSGEALRTLRRRFEDRPALRDLILLQRGNIQRAVLKDPVSARQTYAMLADFYPSSPLADDAAFGLAQCFDEAGDLSAAAKSYENYIALFPAADQHLEAEQRLEWIRSYAPSNASPRDQWIARALLAGGDDKAALAWAAERIEADHDFAAGLSILRQILDKKGSAAIDESRLFSLAGLCHARLSEKYRLEGDGARAALHADTLRQISHWLQEQNAMDDRAAVVNRLALISEWRSLQEPLVRAAMVDTILARIQAPDSLAALLRIDQARIWYRFALDSSSAHWLARANLACSSIAGAYGQPRVRLETALLQSSIFLTLQKPDSAIQVLQGALAGAGSTAMAAKASLDLAGLLEKQNRLAEAATIYQDWTSRYFYSSRSDSIRGRLCRLYFKQQQYDLARACMSQHDGGSAIPDLALYLDRPLDDGLLWLSAQAWLLQNKSSSAITACKEYLRLSPRGLHRAEAMLALADLYILEKNPQAAMGHLDQLIIESPGDTLARVALMRAADLFYDLQNYKEAAPKYARIKLTAAGDLQRLAALREILCEYKLQNAARARLLADAFKKTYKDRKAEALFLLEDGQLCLANKDFKAAENLLKELSTKYKDLPEGADGELGLARMYAILNNTDESLKILTNIPNKYNDPRIVALTYVNLGEFYYENRQLENCITAGRKALEYAVIGPEQQRAIQLLITAFDDLRLWDNAVVLLREYIRDYPDQEDTFNRRVQLGVFLINLKEYDRGIEHLRDLLPLADAESEAEIQYWIAKAFHERGDMSQAITEFLKVKYVCRPSKLPWGTTALYEAGQAYMKLGNLFNARTLFQQIVREMGVGDQFGRVANERIREIDAAMARKKG